MKVTGIRFETLVGEAQLDFPLFEERLIRPIDVYPEHKAEGQSGGGRYKGASERAGRADQLR